MTIPTATSCVLLAKIYCLFLLRKVEPEWDEGQKEPLILLGTFLNYYVPGYESALGTDFLGREETASTCAGVRIVSFCPEASAGLLSLCLGHKYIKTAFALLFLYRFCSCALETMIYL